jgi:hypothetical protein
MKIKMTALFISVLVLAAAAYSQNNSCAYTFTYPKSKFSFCVTVWGTLASIQSPIGVNHLDPANPVEGWSAYVVDNGGGQDGGTVIPGLGALSWTSPPTVRQPHGPGTLPLIFDYDKTFGYHEVVNAAPQWRTIILTLTISSCGDCAWFGTVSRVANIRPDGNSTGNFAHSSFAAFGYVQHGVMLSSETDLCAGADPNGASASTYMDCSISNAPFTGPGAVFSSWILESERNRPMSMKAIYRVF